MTRAELIEALKSAKGPDRELDTEVLFHAIGEEWAAPIAPYYAPHCVGDEPIYWHAPSWLYKRPCPKLTASLDAAISLVERVRPITEWTHSIWAHMIDPDMSPNRSWRGRIWNDDVEFSGFSKASGAIALLIALLSSMED